MHTLDLHIPTELNLNNFKIQDASVYDASISVRNGLVEVVPPGFSRPIVFKVNKNFQLILNSNLLKLNTKGFSKTPELIDGVYKVKYSVDPNLELNIEYYYFRNIKLQSIYLFKLNELIKNKHLFNRKEFLAKKKEFLWINQLIKASKYLAEDMLDIKAATNLYEEAHNEISKLVLI